MLKLAILIPSTKVEIPRECKMQLIAEAMKTKKNHRPSFTCNPKDTIPVGRNCPPCGVPGPTSSILMTKTHGEVDFVETDIVFHHLTTIKKAPMIQHPNTWHTMFIPNHNL